MNRRLNSQLFEDGPSNLTQESGGFSAVASQKIDTEVKDVKKSVSHMESLIEVLQAQMNQLIKNNDTRTAAFSKALTELEKNARDQDLALTQKTRMLEEQLGERRSIDGKIEAMVDRFNMSIQQFENKLAILQKTLSEKEMTMMSYRQIIEKLVDEVEALKALK